MTAPGIIQRLDETVVNRIAAGEVVQRPANALKEMLENSLDAKSTQITVTVKQGGLKLLQIQDNGTGIRKSDMPIVCERFTTSKLREFSDLQGISTYGFRGEALASISHVAHLTITTKTKDDQCAWKCSYTDGKPNGNAKPCAGNQGTQISVEDLFYNVPTRKKALRSISEEHSKVAEVVSRYAIHNYNVGFCLKKQGDSSVDLRTPPKSSAQDNIRIVFGSAVAKELIEVECSNERLQFNCKALVTNANYSAKRCTMLLFINHRLVESTALRKALEGIYSAYLPKQGHPFVYMSLEIAPQNVDVNVHPTKHEVNFLHEDAIIEAVQKAVEQKLLGSNTSRVFYTQSLLPGAAGAMASTATAAKGNPSNAAAETVTSNGSAATASRTYDHSLVRTQPKEQKLTKFLNSGELGQQKNASTEAIQGNTDHIQIEKHDVKKDKNSMVSNCSRKDIKLTSVIQLRSEIISGAHKGLSEIIKDHTFVGCVDEKLALVQHRTHLYLCQTVHLCEQMFYQLMLKDFGNYGIIKLTMPVSIKELALVALDQPESGWTEADGTKDHLAEYIENFLLSKAPMLQDYFSLDVDSKGNLCTLPYLLDKFTPNMTGLPMYILRLSTEVNWDSEEDCFRTFCQETAKFYAAPPLPGEEDEHLPPQKKWNYKVEQLLYPALKVHLTPQQHLAHDTSLLQLADLHQLYKVFERC